jgi:acid phosphatase class B
MKIGLDYWNTISHHPVYFRQLAAAALAAGHEVHVISAIGPKRAGTIAGDVAICGVPVTAVHELVFAHPRESPVLKTARALELGVTVFYDDRDDVCRAMTEAGILAMRVTRPGRRGDIEAEREARHGGETAAAGPRAGRARH